MKCFYTDKPSGVFFAVYSDLSGAYLFKQVGDNKFIEASNDDTGEVDADWFVDAGYLWFFNIDEKFAKHAYSVKGI
jgi:hypothetical protein